MVSALLGVNPITKPSLRAKQYDAIAGLCIRGGTASDRVGQPIATGWLCDTAQPLRATPEAYWPTLNWPHRAWHQLNQTGEYTQPILRFGRRLWRPMAKSRHSPLE
jgi:hypothetical protein